MCLQFSDTICILFQGKINLLSEYEDYLPNRTITTQTLTRSYLIKKDTIPFGRYPFFLQNHIIYSFAKVSVILYSIKQYDE